MRVFILCTGRSGSTAIIRACEHIENYTSGHESLSKRFGAERFKYADQHIESDNRLSWDLGQLDKIFGDDAFYVHLRRDTNKVAESFMSRFYRPASIIDAFCAGIRMTPPQLLDEDERLKACHDYIKTVNSNIELFLKDKSKSMTIELENILDDFPVFWDKIGAVGNLQKALTEFEKKHNASPNKVGLNLKWRFTLFLKGEWMHIKMSRKSVSAGHRI